MFRSLRLIFASTLFVAAIAALVGCDQHSDTAASNPPPTSSSPSAVAYGTRISFGQGGTSDAYKTRGWSKTEEKFTWTEGTSAEMQIPIAATSENISLKMTIAGLIQPPDLPFQPVEVFVNNQRIAEWQVGNTAEFVAAIPAAVTKAGGVLTFEFKMPKATSPKTLGQSADPRVLGICCFALELSKG
jgi:hypothetical protein